MYVAEAPGGRWLHVRIDHREYSIPVGVAEGVLIEVPQAEQPPSARDAYAVLVSRLDRHSWRGDRPGQRRGRPQRVVRGRP